MNAPYRIEPVSVPICPCKDCGNRVAEPNCHMECEAYLKWSALNGKASHNRWKESQRYAISETKKKWINRQLRKSKK